MMIPAKEKLSEALTDIVTGKGVKRSRHHLSLHGESVVEQFVAALRQNGYQQTTVGKVAVEVGERVPAFYLDGSTAYFGWVFWEKFSSDKARKLWGSVVRNEKGDWAIQISTAKEVPIYANPALRIEMDADNPIYL